LYNFLGIGIDLGLLGMNVAAPSTDHEPRASFSKTFAPTTTKQVRGSVVAVTPGANVNRSSISAKRSSVSAPTPKFTSQKTMGAPLLSTEEDVQNDGRSFTAQKRTSMFQQASMRYHQMTQGKSMPHFLSPSKPAPTQIDDARPEFLPEGFGEDELKAEMEKATELAKSKKEEAGANGETRRQKKSVIASFRRFITKTFHDDQKKSADIVKKTHEDLLTVAVRDSRASATLRRASELSRLKKNLAHKMFWYLFSDMRGKNVLVLQL